MPTDKQNVEFMWAIVKQLEVKHVNVPLSFAHKKSNTNNMSRSTGALSPPPTTLVTATQLACAFTAFAKPWRASQPSIEHQRILKTVPRKVGVRTKAMPRRPNRGKLGILLRNAGLMISPTKRKNHLPMRGHERVQSVSLRILRTSASTRRRRRSELFRSGSSRRHQQRETQTRVVFCRKQQSRRLRNTRLLFRAEGGPSR